MRVTNKTAARALWVIPLAVTFILFIFSCYKLEVREDGIYKFSFWLFYNTFYLVCMAFIGLIALSSWIQDLIFLHDDLKRGRKKFSYEIKLPWEKDKMTEEERELFEEWKKERDETI